MTAVRPAQGKTPLLERRLGISLERSNQGCCSSAVVAGGHVYVRIFTRTGGPLMSFVRVSSIVVILAAIAAGTPAAQACTTASVNGVYAILSSGLNGSGLPATSVDQITADGLGNLSGTSTKSIDGTIVTYTFTGTYTVATNCSGTATFTNQDNQVEHDNFILNNANKGAFLIQTDGGHTQSSVAVAEGSATCTDLGVRHSYSFEGTGQVLGTGQVAYVGRLVLNGTGLVTGTATASLNGTITSSTVTGTYTINSDCTGTI